LTITFILENRILLAAEGLSAERRVRDLSKPLASIEDSDFIFENTPVKVVINRNCPEIELVGLKAGPFEEGKEYEIKFWIAEELEKAGIARFHEEGQLDAVKLYKLHWKESVQPTNQIAPLTEDFYPKLRRYLANLKKDCIKKPETMKEYDKVIRLSHDIINCRLKKIVSLSSAPDQTNQVLNNLTKEERIIYERLHSIISGWRTKILKPKEGGGEQ
jgi:hypothetical protein